MSQGGKVPRVQIEVTFPKLVFDLLQKEAKVVYFDFWVPANDHFAFQNIYQIFNKLETFEVEKNMQINYYDKSHLQIECKNDKSKGTLATFECRGVEIT